VGGSNTQKALSTTIWWDASKKNNSQ